LLLKVTVLILFRENIQIIIIKINFKDGFGKFFKIEVKFYVWVEIHYLENELDPAPNKESEMNTDPYRSGSATLYGTYRYLFKVKLRTFNIFLDSMKSHL
jgi:hypothetical protein